MGFLDRMISDMIGDATGLPVRGLVRKIGAKNLLLIGGAVAAGGFAAHKLSTRGGQGGSRPVPGAVPPPPPPAGAAVSIPPPPPAAVPPPPPPPPAAQAGPAGDDELPQGLTYAIVRTMVAAALADGAMAPEERRVIHERLGDSGLAAEQVSQVNQDLVIPPQPEELAAMEADPGHRAAMYRAAFLVARADHDLSEPEQAWLQRLAVALGFDEAQRLELEQALLQLV